MLRFVPTEGYQVAGHRQVLVGPNPLDGATDNICDHIGGFVEIDAKIYRIVEVDVFPKNTPPALGERVGLLVEREISFARKPTPSPLDAHKLSSHF